MDVRQIEVDAGAADERLDKLVARVWPDHSRSFWHRHIAAGRVRVNGRAEKGGYLVKAGQIVSCAFELEAPPVLSAPDPDGAVLPEWVVYCDADLLVINKPRSLVVHPSAGHWTDSVVHRLLPWLPQADGEVRPGVVHRLDRDTSGLMVLARNARARERLSTAIQERTVTRQYVAVVRGTLHPETGTIEAPIGRDPANRLKMAVVQDGREARTHYRMAARWAGASLLVCTLDTGRTHQIRVHVAALGHPVLGDLTYGGRHAAFTSGQLLHAGRLSFSHPITGEALVFESAPPDDWMRLTELGTPRVTSPRLYDETTGPDTAQWLSDRGFSEVLRSC